MAFIIPNATSTASSEKYVAIDQAEPDSLDFEVLGNLGHSGVYRGCGVSLASANTVLVAEGTVVLDGVAYSVPESVVTVTAASNSKFSLITVRVLSGVVSVVAVDGLEDPINPRYPSSSSTSVSGGQINLANSVILAAVYRTSQSLSSGSIVDKRVFLKNSIFNQGAAAPTTGGVVGELYFSPSQETGTNSGLYVRGTTGWVPIQKNVGPQVPVGSVLGWPSSAAIPKGFLAASGQTVNKSDYPDLASAYGITSATFSLPNLNDHVLKGTISSSLAGTLVTDSSDQRTLSVANLPLHDHGSGSHYHSMGHTHSMSHGHSGGTTGSAGGHTHTGNDVYDNTSQYQAIYNGQQTTINFASGNTSANIPVLGIYPVDWALSVSIGTVANHTHSFSVPNYSGSTGQASTSNTGEPIGGDSSGVGGDQAFNNIPKAAYVVWIIRAATGDNQPAGTSIYSSARQEVLTLSYDGTLPSGSADDVASFRLPWPATLTAVKASLDGVGVTATNEISIDINLDGTSVLGTNKLTIDSGESSSFTAATPADISTTDLGNDSLISFDIMSATGESGPLNVVLYVLRND